MVSARLKQENRAHNAAGMRSDGATPVHSEARFHNLRRYQIRLNEASLKRRWPTQGFFLTTLVAGSTDMQPGQRIYYYMYVISFKTAIN